MTQIFERAEIERAIGSVDLIEAMEHAFLNYSAGRAVVPPVGELLFEQPPGDVHIKYGYVRGSEYYVVKVASGFYDNAALGLPSSNGLMLVFRQQTGELAAVLLDQGLLTDVRTAAAGAVAARHLAPQELSRIGIVGTGVQARLQLRWLESVVTCRRVLVCGRSAASLDDFCQSMDGGPWELETTDEPRQVSDSCQLIVTATPAEEPLLLGVKPGTHITAVGSDTAAKQELAPGILASAGLVVVDSRSQAGSRGEVFLAVQAGALDAESLVELGEVLAGHHRGRRDERQITVADLTGVATQDIEVAVAVLQRLQHED
jgi:ornithine cyclodeaminase